MESRRSRRAPAAFHWRSLKHKTDVRRSRAEEEKGVQRLVIIYKGGGQLYIYPDNLKARAALWLWQLKDIGIIGVCALVSVLALTQAGFFLPIVFTAVYAFLTIRFEDASIMDFIQYACAFFFLCQQFFEWRYTE